MQINDVKILPNKEGEKVLNIFNRRFLCKINSVYDKNVVLIRLKKANIEFQCKAKGTNSRTVSSIDGIFWFNIYVNKCDYEKTTKLVIETVIRK